LDPECSGCWGGWAEAMALEFHIVSLLLYCHHFCCSSFVAGSHLGFSFPCNVAFYALGLCVCVCTHMRVSKFCTFFSAWLCVWVGFDWQRNRSVGEWHFSALEITFQHLWGAAKEIGLFETKFQWWGIF
jgi:hypothetical protein